MACSARPLKDYQRLYPVDVNGNDSRALLLYKVHHAMEQSSTQDYFVHTSSDIKTWSLLPEAFRTNPIVCDFNWESFATNYAVNQLAKLIKIGWDAFRAEAKEQLRTDYEKDLFYLKHKYRQD